MQKLMDALKKINTMVEEENRAGTVIKNICVTPWGTAVELSSEQKLIDTSWMKDIGAVKCELTIDGITFRVETEQKEKYLD